MKKFKFTAEIIVEADSQEQAEEIFANNSVNFADNAECEQVEQKISPLKKETNLLLREVGSSLEKSESYRKGTCDSNSYGWSSLEHHAMGVVARTYQDKGHKVLRQVNHGVTDWEIFPKVEVEV